MKPFEDQWRYSIVTGILNSKELTILDQCGLNLSLDSLNSQMKTSQIYTLKDGQTCCDELIKKGCDPAKIRLEYYTGEY